MARIRAILRRIGGGGSPNKQVLHYADLTIDLDEYIVTVADQPVTLTKKEIEILWTLATNQHKVFSRDNLLNSLWGYDYFGDNRTVDTHIKTPACQIRHGAPCTMADQNHLGRGLQI